MARHAAAPDSRFAAGRRRHAAVALLASSLALGGCFEDSFVMMDDDEGQGPASSSGPADTGPTTSPMPDTTGVDGGSTLGDSTGAATGVTDTEGDSSSGSGASDSSEGGEDSTTGPIPLHVDELSPGDLVVTEVMWNPNCEFDDCEWIEVYNATELPVNLLDLFVQDSDLNGGNQGRVTRDVIVPPGDVAVITRGVGSWPYPFAPDAVYGPSPGFNNGSLEFAVLLNDHTILDQTWFFDLDQEEGIAWSLSGDSLDAVSNDDESNWCVAVDELSAGIHTEFGTPGELNPPC